MTRRQHILDQFNDVGGSCSQQDNFTPSNEPLMLGKVVAGQSGSSASIVAISGSNVTVSGLTGMSSASVGRFLSLEGANSSSNNGTFLITGFVSATQVTVQNAGTTVPDGNNGSLSWIEREPYSLEDDLNYRRTQERLIKGTGSWYDELPTYVRPTNTLVDVDANLTNISSKTTDAKTLLENRFVESTLISTNDTFITVVDTGNLKHADSVNITGIPVFDGYDSGDFIKAYVHIVDANLDGYNDGGSIFVLSGENAGEQIFGVTRVGSSTSPNSVEIAFYSRPVTDWSFASVSPYTWEASQINLVNFVYSYRQRLDYLDENTTKSAYVTGISSSSSTNSGGTSLPTPTEVGQVLFTTDGLEFTVELPLTGDFGWLVNDDGILLVVG